MNIQWFLALSLISVTMPAHADWSEGTVETGPSLLPQNVEFVVSVYRGSRTQNQVTVSTIRGARGHHAQTTETIQVANGETAFLGTSEQIPLTMISSGSSDLKNQKVDTGAQANAAGSFQLNQTALGQNQGQLGSLQSVLGQVGQQLSGLSALGTSNAGITAATISQNLVQSLQGLNNASVNAALSVGGLTAVAAQSLLLSQQASFNSAIQSNQQNSAAAQAINNSLANNPNTGQLENAHSGLKVVQYKTLESGIQIKPKLMGRMVQLELIQKDDHFDPQTKVINSKNSRHVVIVPIGQWMQVSGNQDSEDENLQVYSTNRDESSSELWVKVEQVSR